MNVMRLFLFRRNRRTFPRLVFFLPGTQTQWLISEITCAAALLPALHAGTVLSV